MQIHRKGSAPNNSAPEDGFTGEVLISGYFSRDAPSRLTGAAAAFAPGARTPWKTNPYGQTLIVIDGVGWAQSEGEQVVEIRAGDLIWFAPGQRHWEGATPDQGMTYIAIQEGGVDFGERVTEAQYRAGPG